MLTPWIVARVTSYLVKDTSVTLRTTILYALLLAATHFVTTNITCRINHSLMKLGSVIRYWIIPTAFPSINVCLWIMKYLQSGVTSLLELCLKWLTTGYWHYFRVSLSGLVYRKACRISQAEMGRTSVAHIINLITNDATRIDEVQGNNGRTWLYLQVVWKITVHKQHKLCRF